MSDEVTGERPDTQGMDESPAVRNVMKRFEDRREIQRLRARVGELENSETQLIQERDEAEEAADKLAYSIASLEEIGEHSNVNDPWENAVEKAEELHERIAGLEDALKPFAEYADGLTGVNYVPDECPMGTRPEIWKKGKLLRVHALREARRVLGSARSAE
jgi:predicted nuclease with TOPRIM domain